MKYLSQFLILKIFVVLSSFQLLSTDYHKKTTNELKEHLNNLVKTYRAAGIKPPKDLEQIRTFVIAKANPNISTDLNLGGDNALHINALHIAAEAGDTNLIRFLLEYKANIDHKSGHGLTALMYAAAKKLLGYYSLREQILRKASITAFVLRVESLNGKKNHIRVWITNFVV
jgi:hypothetical protein